MAQDDLQQLIERAQSLCADILDRHQAYGELVVRFGDMAYGYAYSLLGNAQLAQDAVQEAFLLAYRRLEQLHEPAAFGAWLRRIVHSQCGRLTRRREEEAMPIDDLPALSSGENDPERLVEGDDTRRRILNAVQGLPEHERVATVLYYIDGYSQREVADFMEVTVDAVKKRLQRARQHLSQELMEIIGEHLMAERTTSSEEMAQEIRLSLALEAAAQGGQLAMLEALIVDGLDLNEATYDGQTLLHWAAQEGHLDAIELLLRSGARPGVRNAAGQTPLEVALACKQRAAAEMLRRARS